MVISLKTEKLIASLDAQLANRLGYETAPMRNNVDILARHGLIEDGWREACGKTDPTAHIHRTWVRVITALRKDGVTITEERQKHKNAYATNHGGFWQSIIYTLHP
jgi:hypothetical protein